MTEFSAQTSSHADFFDPAAVEARLNALVGDKQPKADSAPTMELVDSFLGDPDLEFLGSRCSTTDETGKLIQTVIEYHRVATKPNQSRVIVHLAFRPDFAVAPSVEVTLLDVEGRVRLTHCTHFGARIEVTLAHPQPDASMLCLEAVCTSEQSNNDNPSVRES